MKCINIIHVKSSKYSVMEATKIFVKYSLRSKLCCFGFYRFIDIIMHLDIHYI
jgi:hypothetical protein